MRDLIVQALTRNLLLKLVSLGFAVSLWIVVSLGQTESEVPAKVSIEIKNLPKKLVRTSDLPSELEIKVRGPRTVMRNVRDRELRYVIDLSGAVPGPMIAKIYAPKIENLPRGARVTEIVPSQIQINLSARKNKAVPVKPVLRGETKAGFDVLGTVVEPSIVEVSGAAEEIELLTEIDTEIIDIAGRTKTFTVEAGLDLLTRHVEAVQQQNVRVTVQIGEPRINQVFYGIPITIVNTPYQVDLSKSELDVALEGSQDQVLQLTPGDLQLIIDAADLAPGQEREIVPTLKVPEGMGFAKADMPPVTITILDKKKKVSKKKFK